MPLPYRIARWVGALGVAALLCACASTTVTLTPEPNTPVCNPATSALVLWAPVWRANQKDVESRETVAARGLDQFFSLPSCFASTRLQRVDKVTPKSIAAALTSATPGYAKVVGIEVQELGPVVKLLSSAALLEGGTEVLLRVTEYAPQSGEELRGFTVHWRQGGAGVVKGVTSLPQDLQSALHAGLQPAATQ